MIISCPDCATRYDVDDARFTPDGRSVRCTACGISWFVPAPEPIDDLIDDLVPLGPDDEAAATAEPKASMSRLKVRMDELAARAAEERCDDGGEQEDDLLFDDFVRDDDGGNADHGDDQPAAANNPIFAAAAENRDQVDDRADDQADDRTDDDDRVRGWKRGGQFIADGDSEEDGERRPFFALRSRKKKNEEEEAPRRSFFSRFDRDADDEEDDRDDGDDDGEVLSSGSKCPDRAQHNEPSGREERAHRDADNDDTDKAAYDDEETHKFGRADRSASNTDDRHTDDISDGGGDDESHGRFDEDTTEDLPGPARIVDADWEDVDDDDDEDGNGQHPRGFGRRMREQRRRATAIARVEPIDPRFFDDEFFATLRVHPKELEKALRKARRRAEAREKNRMTPLRALGWSTWIGAVAATIFAVVVYREEIVKAAPGAADAYQVFGVEANPQGLAIENVRHRLAMSTGGPTIEITGAIRNIGDDPVAPPLLQAEALGPRGELLARWTFTANEGELLAGGAAPFITRAAAPDGVVEVALSFAPANPTRRN